MSLVKESGLHSGLELGDVLPKAASTSKGSHLFVSLSDLILDSVFYHPAIKKPGDLSSIEQTSLASILNSIELSEHFVSSLTNQVIEAITPEHKAIRVSLSSADSSSFRSLIGGSEEAIEENPALGLRGVSRYASSGYSHAFAMECQVIKSLREQGYNVEVVVPFVRALSDAAKIIDCLAEQGLPRGLNGLKVLFEVDVPSSALLAEKLLHYFDGVVVNVENLAQFTLGVDRNSETLEYLFDVQNEAVLGLIDTVVKSAKSTNKPIVLVSHSLPNYHKLQEHIVEQGAIDVIVTA